MTADVSLSYLTPEAWVRFMGILSGIWSGKSNAERGFSTLSSVSPVSKISSILHVIYHRRCNFSLSLPYGNV
jgi:hypothetical protein